MNPMKMIAGLAIAGGLAAGAVGVSTGVAGADPGPGVGSIPVRWGPPPPPPPGQGWNPGPVGWGPPPPPPPPYYGGGPIPGGWNGGWEPQGGFCLGPFCI